MNEMRRYINIVENASDNDRLSEMVEKSTSALCKRMFKFARSYLNLNEYNLDFSARKTRRKYAESICSAFAVAYNPYIERSVAHAASITVEYGNPNRIRFEKDDPVEIRALLKERIEAVFLTAHEMVHAWQHAAGKFHFKEDGYYYDDMKVDDPYDSDSAWEKEADSKAVEIVNAYFGMEIMAEEDAKYENWRELSQKIWKIIQK